MLTVVCVYKPGGGFDDSYAERLKWNVEKFSKVDFDFVCFSNQKLKGIDNVIPFKRNARGFWNKLEIFRSGVLSGPVVYLDLDTIIVSDVTDVLTHSHGFTAGQNFKSRKKKCLASWFLGFDADIDRGYLFDEYTKGTPEQYEQSWDIWGDQGFIESELREPWESMDDLFPGRTVSYKWGVRRQGTVPESASFVAFHGRPRPHDINWELPNGCSYRNKQ